LALESVIAKAKHMLQIRALKDIVLNDLKRAQKLVRALAGAGGGIEPQFRIATPEGDFWIAMPLSDDRDERPHQIGLIRKFMASKTSIAFTMAAEANEPDGVFCLGVTYREALCAISAIERSPLRFSPIKWPEPSQVSEELLSLLPHGQTALTPADIEELSAPILGLTEDFRLCG
jgi:hypothetical protein